MGAGSAGVGGGVVNKHKRGVHPARTDTPPANVVLRVWYAPEQREIEAVWDGQQWRGRAGDVLEPQPAQPAHWYAA